MYFYGLCVCGFACISKLVRVVGSQTEKSQIKYECMRVDLYCVPLAVTIHMKKKNP